MNQFRDITMLALIAAAIALIAGGPENWTWPRLGGDNLVMAVQFLIDGRPWSVIIMFALALALFMTRLKY
jgi:hypothetical protein